MPRSNMSRTLSFTLLVGSRVGVAYDPAGAAHARVDGATQRSPPCRADFLSARARRVGDRRLLCGDAAQRHHVVRQDPEPVGPAEEGRRRLLARLHHRERRRQEEDRHEHDEGRGAASASSRPRRRRARRSSRRVRRTPRRCSRRTRPGPRKADAAANPRRRGVKKEEGKAAARAKQEADIAKQAEKKAAKAAKKAAAKKRSAPVPGRLPRGAAPPRRGRFCAHPPSQTTPCASQTKRRETVAGGAQERALPRVSKTKFRVGRPQTVLRPRLGVTYPRKGVALARWCSARVCARPPRRVASLTHSRSACARSARSTRCRDVPSDCLSLGAKMSHGGVGMVPHVPNPAAGSPTHRQIGTKSKQSLLADQRHRRARVSPAGGAHDGRGDRE